MSMRLTVMVMGLCFAASASIAQADVYKWTDADGRVHYGDQAKQGAEKVKIGPDSGEAAVTDNSPDPADKKKHAEECGRKRDRLSTYGKASRIVETDSLGNDKEYNDAERKQLIERTQKQVDEGCADVPAESSKAK